ncbi:DUF4259 domain-containing protein [Streptomyces sp. NBRC 109706]|uniref:DUF4259 domain-containing protein n=1 Tax=Streptomyces sp. NBRC 109706 TaxID=1550035 RepID=UPI0007838C6A|nr:DUF4259 domain-containing protein [Streptomyces sp. NBRC 109706]
MGAWGVGPFDNDMAADFGGALDDAEPAERAERVRAALAEAADHQDYLDSYEASRAVAAAALIVEQLPGGTPDNRHYRPKEPLPDLTALRGLAVRALDRVVADDSELRELWAESGGDDWAVDIARLRALLAAPGQPVAPVG